MVPGLNDTPGFIRLLGKLVRECLDQMPCLPRNYTTISEKMSVNSTEKVLKSTHP